MKPHPGEVWLADLGFAAIFRKLTVIRSPAFNFLIHARVFKDPRRLNPARTVQETPTSHVRSYSYSYSFSHSSALPIRLSRNDPKGTSEQRNLLTPTAAEAVTFVLPIPYGMTLE